MGKSKVINKLRWCKVAPSVGRDGFDRVRFTIINYQGEEILQHDIELKFFRNVLNRRDGCHTEARHFYKMKSGQEYVFQINEKGVNRLILDKKNGHNINSKIFGLCNSDNKINKKRDVFNLINTKYW